MGYGLRGQPQENIEELSWRVCTSHQAFSAIVNLLLSTCTHVCSTHCVRYGVLWYVFTMLACQNAKDNGAAYRLGPELEIP